MKLNQIHYYRIQEYIVKHFSFLPIARKKVDLFAKLPPFGKMSFFLKGKLLSTFTNC